MTANIRKQRSDKGIKRGSYHSWTPEEKQTLLTYHAMNKTPQWIQQNKLPHLTTNQISKQLDNLRVRKEIATGQIVNPTATSNLEDMIDRAAGGDFGDLVEGYEDEEAPETELNSFDTMFGNLVFVKETESYLLVWAHIFPGITCLFGPVLSNGIRVSITFPMIPKILIGLNSSLSEDEIDVVYRNFEETRAPVEFTIPCTKELSQSTDGYKEWKRKVKINENTFQNWVILRVEFSTVKRVRKVYGSENESEYELLQ